jgi:hypothetical protein
MGTTIGVIVILAVAAALIVFLIWSSRQGEDGSGEQAINFSWNIYPDIIFPQNCFVHAEYNVTGGGEDIDIKLVLFNAETHEQVAIWNSGRNFVGGFEGNSAMLNNGTAGTYLFRLTKDGKNIPFAEHKIIILNAPTDEVDHLIACQYPTNDLMETNVFNFDQEITNIRVRLPDEPAKEGEAIPFVLCTKYMSIKSIKLNAAPDWADGDTIDITIGSHYLGQFSAISQIISFDPIIITDRMNLHVSHLYAVSSIGTARHFVQGSVYTYKFSFEFELVQ